ncbi:unnamed protein product [Cylicocyclus nassatus]|uniref:SSD domain-containing protein n=1 Tax=Cylicocyclus nassatus TaxID=53992 RepID=A0AA36GEK4_CYLNA|nr:unnamed protein product [Cylicocyclus nassatus]
MDKLHTSQDDGKLAQMRSAICSRYFNIVLGHPWKVILTTLTVSFILVAISISFHYDIFDFDPTTGFETRGTALANARLTLDAIKRTTDLYEKLRTAASKEEIMQAKKILEKTRRRRQAKTFKIDQSAVEKVVYSNGSGIYSYTRLRKMENFTTTTTLEPISIDYNDYGVDSAPNKRQIDIDPCIQYSAVGTFVPYHDLEFLAKIILEVEDNKLFTLEVFRKMCEVDKVIDAVVEKSVHKPVTTRAKYSFNLPHYSNCLNFTTPNKCSALNQPDIDYLKNAVQRCRKDPSLNSCKTPLMGQVLNYLLPQSESDSKHVAIVLKVPLHGKGNNDMEFYNDLLSSLRNHFSKPIILKGAHFNLKEDEFLNALSNDTKLAFISAALVLLCFLLYSRSIFYTFIIALIIMLSMGVAFFFYAVILKIRFFTALNTLALALMIAVGADDAFLLMVYYRKYKKLKEEPYQVGEPYVPLYKEHDRIIRAIRSSLQHSLASMFVTSATTAVAFISNLTSNIIVLRCFGVYACLTVMVNFVLVVSLLPSTMVITCTERQRKFLPQIDIASKFSHMIYTSRIVILTAGVSAALVAFIIVFVNPGLPMPRYNPAKMLRNSHPYEWYANNAHLFNFEWHLNVKFTEHYIIGISPISDTTFFDPYKKYEPPTRTVALTFTKKDIEKIQVNIAMLVNKRFPDYKSWLDGFLSSNITCKNEEVINASCLRQFAAESYSPVFSDYAVTPSDGPIFDANYRLLGYFISTLSNETLALDFKVLEIVAQTIEANCKKMVAVGDLPIMCLTSSDLTKLYDVIATFSSSTLYSVIISVAASLLVVILCTRRLVLSLLAVAVVSGIILWTIGISIMTGWELSVVESTILILTIGLSFDFTLHMAVSYRDSKEILVEDRIRSCLSSAGRACMLGATTSILCGIPLIFGETAAFTQIGSLLIILGMTSLFGAVIVFPAALACWSTIRSQKVSSMRL